MGLQGAPILRAVIVSSGAAGERSAEVWCDWCEAVHRHGAFSGSCVSHCACKDSPYRETGYVVRLPDAKPMRGNAMPAALFAGRQRLREALFGATAGLRATLLREVLALRGCGIASKRVGRARVSVFGSTWTIDPDASPLIAGDGTVSPMRPIWAGRDYITLLAASHGVSRGAVGVMLLEVVANVPLPQGARENVAAALEAGYARAAEDRGPRRPPPALYGGGECLRGSLARAADGLRSALLRSVLAARVRPQFSKRFGTACVQIDGGDWTIDLGKAPSTAGRSPGLHPRVGRGYLSLLSALYGVGSGVVAVRLLEAVTGASFDAKAKLSIAAAVEAGSAPLNEVGLGVVGGPSLSPAL